MGNKYYAVYEGHVPGVYESNTEFMKQHKGFHKPSGKSFKNKEDAEKSYEEYEEQKQRGNLPIQSGLSPLPVKTKQKRIRIGFPDEHYQFIACIILHLLIPLIPLLLEHIVIGHLSTKTLTLIAAIYSITIGRTTKNPAQFAIGIVISLIFSACYGLTVQEPPASAPHVYSTLDYASMAVIFAIFLMHALERYNKHVVDLEPFLTLKKD